MEYNNVIVLLGWLTALLEYFDLQNLILFKQFQSFPRLAPGLSNDKFYDDELLAWLGLAKWYDGFKF